MQSKQMKHRECILSVCLFLFAIWKSHIGMHSDEVHSIAVGDMLARGNSFFKECWFYLQLSGVFTAPVIWVYEKIVGSAEGILLFFRGLSVCIQGLICIFFYRTFSGKYNKQYVFAASVVLFVFVPDFQSFNYKQEIIWFTTLLILFLYKFYDSHKIKYLIFMGIAISANVLAYPTTIVLFPVCLILVYKLCCAANEKVDAIKGCFLVGITCVICATIFLGFVLSQISFAELLCYFPIVFSDDNLDASFLSKLWHPAVKFTVLGGLCISPMLLYQKMREKFCFPYIPVATILICFAFVGQIYIERVNITWHCITYPYALTLFMVPYLYWNDNNKTKDIRIMQLIELITVAAVLCIALASNQGNITSMYGCIFSVVGLLLMLGDDDRPESDLPILKEKKMLCISIVIMALSMYFYPVYEQESVETEQITRCTIFTARKTVDTGAVRGIRLGQASYDRYMNITQVVTEHTTDNDKVFIIDDDKTASYGYLNASGIYATYSPQGGWGLKDSDKAVRFWTSNSQLEPTVVIIHNSYIGGNAEDYIADSDIGTYMQEHGFQKVDEKNGYSVYRKDIQQ